LLSKIKQNLQLLSIVISSVILCGGLFFSFNANAQEVSVSLADSIRAAVNNSDKSKTGINLSSLPEDQTAEIELERQAEIAAERAINIATKRAKQHNKRSYKRASEGLLPLSPGQVRKFMYRLESTQIAAQPPHTGDPKGEVKIETVSLDPGAKPPVINLNAGYVTTIDIIDQTGEPWPILDIGIGGNFEVTPTESGSHIIRIVPLTRFGKGNISVLLKGLSTPVIFRLSSGGSKYHMRFDARIPKLGPFARTPIIRQGLNLPVAGSEIISMILENAPPENAVRLGVSGVDSRTKAWKVGENVYVRTPLSLLSPAWNASASSADGMTVYEIGNAPVLLMSDNGAMVRARLMQENNYDK